MKITLVVFVNLLFWATSAQSQPEPQQVPTQPQPQAKTTETPRAEGRWIHTEQYGTIWIPKTQIPKAPDDPNASGQWVFTAQYGWLWMPYAIQYVHEPLAQGAYPQAYVYYPSFGWRWVIAPWVWGWGTVPFYGDSGPWHFGWYRGPTYVHPGWGRGADHRAEINPGARTDRAVPVRAGP